MDFSDVSVRPITSTTEMALVVQICKDACQDYNFEYGDFFDKYPKSLWWGLFINEEMAGAIRVIRPEEGLPVCAGDGWPELAVEANSCELALVSLAKKYRGQRRLFVPLYVAFFHYCQSNGIEHVYAILNRTILRLYNVLGIKFQKIGEEKLYWNDPSFPAYLSISETGAYVKEHRPELWAITEAFALNGSFMPGP